MRRHSVRRESGIDAKIDVGLVAQFAQGELEPGARDGGPRKIQRQIERLLVEPVVEAGLEDFQDARLEQRVGIGVGGSVSGGFS